MTILLQNFQLVIFLMTCCLYVKIHVLYEIFLECHNLKTESLSSVLLKTVTSVQLVMLYRILYLAKNVENKSK